MSSFLTGLSARERRLALVVAVAAAAFLAYLLYLPARNRLAALDAEIERIELQVVNSAHMAARSYDINERHRLIAAQHSTGMTKAEIHDSLLRELDTLSLMDPADAEDLAKLARAPRLLRIAQHQEGQLLVPEEGGYREYQTSFQVRGATIEALAEFLLRLQQSPQALRTDRLELRRPNPRQKALDATVTVTRTVIDQAPDRDAPDPAQPPVPPPPPMEGNIARNAGFETYNADRAAYAEWDGDGVAFDAAPDRATEGGNALKAEAQRDGATIGQVQSLVGGRTYTLGLDLAATGPVHLRIFDVDAGEPVEGAQEARADGRIYRYQARFQAPGPENRVVRVSVPHLVIDRAGTVIHADHVVLEEVQP